MLSIRTVRFIRILVYALLLLCVFSSVPVSAQQAQNVTDIVREASSSVVTLRLFDDSGQELGVGSGFLLQDGRIATNHHVVAGGAWVEVVNGDGALLGSVSHAEAISSRLDVAILPGIGASVPGIPLAPTLPEQGEAVVVIGSPEGLGNSVSEGIVSAIRTIDDRRLIQFTAPVSAGSSGGPVLNADGRVVGLTVSILRSGQNLNFAVPVDALRALMESPPGRLAFGPEPTEPGLSRFGSGSADPDLGQLEIGQAVEGELSSGDAALDDGRKFDVYYFFGSAGETVRIRMESDEIDSWVGLARFDEDSIIDVGEDDDSGSGLDAELVAELDAEALYVVFASAYSSEDAGPYLLSLSDERPGPGRSPVAGTDELTIVLTEISDAIQETDPSGRLFQRYLRRRLEDLDVRVIDQVPEVSQGARCWLEVVSQTLDLNSETYDIAVAPLWVLEAGGRMTRSRPMGILMYHGYDDLAEAARNAAEGIVSSLGPLCEF